MSLMKMVKGHLGALVAILSICVLLSASSALNPYFLAKLMDLLSQLSEVPQVQFTATLLQLCAANAAAFALGYATTTMIGRLASSLTRELRREVFHAYLRTQLRGENAVGETLSVLISDVSAVASFVTGNLSSVVSSLCSFVGTSVVLLQMSPRLLMVAASGIPLFLIGYLATARLVTRAAVSVRESFKDVSDVVSRGISQRRTLVLHRGTSFMDSLLEKAANRLYVDSVHQINVGALSNVVLSVVSTAVTMVVIWKGGSMVLGGLLTLGVVVAFLSNTGRLLGPVSSIVQCSLAWRKTQVALEHISRVLSQPRLDEGALRMLPEKLVFRSTVLYPGAAPTEADVQLDGIVSLRGDTGSGKSTIAEILAGIREPHMGTVTRQGARGGSATHAGVVLLDSSMTLLGETLHDDLLLGREGSDADIRQMLDLVELSEVLEAKAINALSRLDVKSLSHGEIQRLLLARALLMKPSVLILDEALSGVEPDLFSRIMDRIRPLVHTVVVISHRESDHDHSERSYEVINGAISPVH